MMAELFLAFVLGAAVGMFLPAYRLRMLWWKIENRLPKRCPDCGQIHQRRRMQLAKHRVAGWVWVCRDCYDNQYQPFSRGSNQETP